MKLEDQVCSLELAKHLKELGVRRGSYFVWHDSELAGSQVLIRKSESIYAQKYADFVAAYTVSELGEMLPEKVTVEYKEQYIDFDRFNGWWLYYLDEPDDKTFSENEADARAKLLIYLIEKGLIPSPTQEGAKP